MYYLIDLNYVLMSQPGQVILSEVKYLLVKTELQIFYSFTTCNETCAGIINKMSVQSQKQI